MHDRVTLQDEVPAKGDLGGEQMAWVDEATVWAAVDPLRGKEFFAAQQVNSEVSHQVTIRYRTGVTPKKRLLWDGRVLEITAVLPSKERRRYLHLMCVDRGVTA